MKFVQINEANFNFFTLVSISFEISYALTISLFLPER